MAHHFLVNVVQLVERQFVALVVVGSSPIVHPKIEKKAILLQGGFFYVHLVKNLPSILLFPDHTELFPKYE